MAENFNKFKSWFHIEQLNEINNEKLYEEKGT